VSGAGSPAFRFVQFELPWRLGPADGRYLVREPDGGVARVLVIATLGAVERRRLGGRGRPRGVAAEPAPASVLTTRGTVVDGEPVAIGEAEAWLGAVDDAVVADAFAVVVRAVAFHRVAAADPGAVMPALSHALVVRVGYGGGEEVAVGRWASARELPVPAGGRRQRSVVLAPQERLAALLGGRASALVCEELALRAQGDLDAGRFALAAAGVRMAFEAALAELPAEADRYEKLRGLAGPVTSIASRALREPLAPDAIDTLTAALGRLEAALRARASGP
jgi:hypothetical protein